MNLTSHASAAGPLLGHRIPQQQPEQQQGTVETASASLPLGEEALPWWVLLEFAGRGAPANPCWGPCPPVSYGQLPTGGASQG